MADAENFQDALRYLKKLVYKPPGQAGYAEVFLDLEAFRRDGRVFDQVTPDCSHDFGELLEARGFSLDQQEAVIRDHRGRRPV